MNTQEFVAQIRLEHPEFTDQEILAYANTPYWHPNPVPQQIVPKPVEFLQLSQQIPPAERFAVQNQGMGTYRSLLANLTAGKLQDAAVDIETLCASGLLPPETVLLLQSIVADVMTGMPDPNWQPNVYTTRCQDLGLQPLMMADLC